VSPDSRVGTEIAGYRIESVLGRGGMGVVYVARHLRLDRTVALKVVSPELAEDPKFRDRFVRESRLAASLEHPNIVPIHDAGEADGVLYLAMRLVQGTDLKSLIAEDEGLDPARTVRLLDQAAGALDAAHQAGLVHRDVKPGNVLVASPGTPGEHAYLSDFGLTKRMTSDSGLTGTGQFVGTLDYAAPEQFEGKQLDGRADVYSLGCVLYECLTGEIPFRRDNQAALVYAHLMAEPPKVTERRPELPEAIDVVVAKGMAKKPEERYSTAGELVAAAREALGETTPGGRPMAPSIAAPPAPRAVRPGTAGTRTRVEVVGGLVLLAAIAVGAILLLTRGGGGSASPSTSAGTSAAALTGKDRVVRIDPATRTIKAAIPVQSSPAGIVVAEGSIWVVNSGSNSVSRIDPVSNRVTGTVPVGKQPSGIAFDNGSIWVANALGNNVSKIDPGTNKVVATIPAGIRPTTIAAGDGVLAVGTANEQPQFPPRSPLLLVDEDSGSVIATLDVPGICTPFVSQADGIVWTGSGAGTLLKIDAPSGTVLKRSELGFPIAGVAVEGGEVYIATDGQPAQVRAVDPDSLAIEATIPIGTTRNITGAGCDPISIVPAGQFTWVTNRDDGTVSQIEIASNAVVNVVTIHDKPIGMALGFNSLWVTVDAP
jgi:YVTN family beta-propeller protein